MNTISTERLAEELTARVLTVLAKRIEDVTERLTPILMPGVLVGLFEAVIWPSYVKDAFCRVVYQPNLKTTAGTIYWYPGEDEYRVVILPEGPGRPPRHVLTTLFHETRHVMVGDVPRGDKLPRWVDPDTGFIDEQAFDVLYEARQRLDPSLQAIEDGAAKWAREETAKWCAPVT